MTTGIVAAIEHLQKSPQQLAKEDAEKLAQTEKVDLSNRLLREQWLQNKQTQEFFVEIQEIINDLNVKLSSIATSTDEIHDRLAKIYLVQRKTLEGVLHYARDNDKNKF